MQNGHNDVIHDVVFTPDGRLIVSASADRTIKLWEVLTGRIVRTLVGHTLPVKSIAVSPDGRRLASTEKYGPIRIWDLNTGLEVRQFAEKTGAIHDLAFTAEGLLLSLGAEVDYTWDITTGNAVRSFNRLRKVEQFLRYKEKGVEKTADVSSYILDLEPLALSPDGRRLAFLDKEKRIVIRDSDGKEICKLTGKTLTTLLESVIRAFSTDGTWFALGESINGVSVWNTTTGEMLFRLSFGEQVIGLAFQPDSQVLAVGTFIGSSGKGRLRFLRVPSGEEVRIIEIETSPSHLAFTKDGRLLACGGRQSLALWDVFQRSFLRTMRGSGQYVEAVAISPNGRLLATAVDGNAPRLWDLASGDDLGVLPASSLPPGSGVAYGYEMAFSPDGLWLAAARSFLHKRLHLWEVNTGTPKIDLPGNTTVAFSPDARRVATTIDGSVKVWETTTGREVLSWIPRHNRRSTQALAFSPDNRWLAEMSIQGYLALWDLTAGRESPSFLFDRGYGGMSRALDLAFSPDGKLLAVAGGSGRGIVTLFDPETGERVRRLEVHDWDTSAVVFSAKGEWFATASELGEIKIWETSTGRELRKFVHTGGVKGLAVSPDSRRLASAGTDGSTRIWETNSGEQLLLLTSLPGTPHWVVVSPDGLFDGSIQGISQLVAWRFGNETLPLETFFNEFYHPGLLAEIVAGKRPKATKDISTIDRRQSAVTLVLSPDAKRPATSRAVNLKIEVKEAPPGGQHSNGSGARDLRLFRNGLLVRVWRGDVLKGKSSVSLEATVPIIAGENHFTAYAFNRDNIKSSDATLTVEGAESLRRKGIAYILAIGVNEYANSEYNLSYAVADAQAFAEETKRQQAKLTQYERVEIISLNDKGATKGDILKSLADLSGKTQPEDAVIIFFAGHGTAQGNRFYLIPHDLGYRGSRQQLDSPGLQSILNHSISDEELERAVEGIDAGQLLMVIDACNSGQALEAEEKRRGPMNSKGLAQLAYEKGMYILTAAQSYQAALEAAKLGHGYLTYALVEEGLKTNASDRTPKDGQVLVREWLDFATARVPEMQMEKIEEQRKMGRELGLVIKFVESDTGPDRNVQRPRVFYRREMESNPMIVARP
jgi:WD40 repeat protein